ncbi:Proteasome activator PA28 like protein [Aduncisulcus paluster]|uniref:Proteasome activator PA28 like protein n=1 Tax=Aduncisulcus paluster TaxID=2918883 RepID=A0ABQ5K2V5_9EUKA|nr:Proteasome activator PA28 like protein [Aduncisulcus paluster]
MPSSSSKGEGSDKKAVIEKKASQFGLSDKIIFPHADKKYYKKQIKKMREEMFAKGEKSIAIDFPSIILRLHDLLKTEDILEKEFPKKFSLAALKQLLGSKILEETHLISPKPDDVVGKRRTSSSELKDDSHSSSKEEEDRNFPMTLPERIAHITSLNEKTIAFMEVLKKEVRALLVALDSAKMMIQLRVPKIEGGNNLGVDIQEECLSDILRVIEATSGVFDDFFSYHATRATLVNQIIRNPGIVDYYFALVQHEEKQLITFRTIVFETINNMLVLSDLIKKNEEAIKKPKGTSSSISNMY